MKAVDRALWRRGEPPGQRSRRVYPAPTRPAERRAVGRGLRHRGNGVGPAARNGEAASAHPGGTGGRSHHRRRSRHRRKAGEAAYGRLERATPPALRPSFAVLSLPPCCSTSPICCPTTSPCSAKARPHGAAATRTCSTGTGSWRLCQRSSGRTAFAPASSAWTLRAGWGSTRAGGARSPGAAGTGG